MEDMTAKNMYDVLAKKVSREANLRTDELAFYKGMDWNFASHEMVKHSEDEYVRRRRAYQHNRGFLFDL